MEERKFQTKVKHIKYDICKEIIKRLDNGGIEDAYLNIPQQIIPGPKATLRCCIYKERAIVQQRLKLVLGGNKDVPNVIEVLDIACDECPVDGILVTAGCRSCLYHNCKHTCPTGAINTDNKVAEVDKSKCIQCGACVKACPYNALVLQRRPCVLACKANAIHIGDNQKAMINYEKCVTCGVCTISCPFGAISNKSEIVNVVSVLKQADSCHVYAIYAPAIVGQFSYATPGQVVSGLKQLGFYRSVEVALGAEITRQKEAAELDESGRLLSSCCPPFVEFVKKNFPELEQYLSKINSPMIETAMAIKSVNPDAKVIFISPCTGKYAEAKSSGVVDCVLSFEELEALFDARQIDISALPETQVKDAGYYGRIFAKSGGPSEAIASQASTNVNPCVMSGLEQCKVELLKLKHHSAVNNFFEGMACDGGCVNGPLTIWSRSRTANAAVTAFSKEGKTKDEAT